MTLDDARKGDRRMTISRTLTRVTRRQPVLASSEKGVDVSSFHPEPRTIEFRVEGDPPADPFHLTIPAWETDVPRWMQVWTWARWMRDPREPRAFPQQRSGFNSSVTNGDNAPAYMTDREYEQLEREWAQAGSPKWKPTEILRTAGITR